MPSMLVTHLVHFFFEYYELDVMYLEMTLEDMNKVRVVASLDPYIVPSSEE